jgi:HlyD family secretion protein
MTRRRVLLASAMLVALLSAVFGFRERRPGVSVAATRRGTLRVAVSCAGVLQPPQGGELRARESATVARILAKEGQRLHEGDAILELRDPELRSRESQVREEVLQLEAEAAVAAGEVARARQEAEQRRTQLAADQRLLDAGAIPRSDLEASTLQARDAAARLAAAEARLLALGSDSPGSTARLALARSRARDLGQRAAGLVLRAPFAGVVYGLPRREDEAVAAGQVVASVTDPDRPELRVKVDEPDLPRIAEGQRIAVSFDGLPESRFEGRLHSVGRGLREAGGREVAEVLGTIEDPQHQLPWNASVNVEVVVAERPGVLIVPRAALGREGDRRFVWLLADGRAVRREVKVGAVSTSEAAVDSGLAEGESVILPGTTVVHDGERVAVTKP